jgi:exocyst complex component 4
LTHHRRRPLRREETTEEESPEDIRQRNMREAEILASNLGEGGISAHEILSDVGQLKGLAQLQESMASLVTLVHVQHAEQCALPSGPYACC